MTTASPSPAVPLAITGDLTISTVGEWHRRLAESNLPATGGVIDLAGVTAADVFGVQLLCALHRSAGAAGRLLHLAGTPPVVLAAATAAGIPPTAFLTRL